MKDIIDQVKQALLDNGAENIYMSFDALPLKHKEEYFIILGIKSYETTDPVYSDSKIFMPVKAEIEISAAAPENSTAEKLYDYYAENIEGAVDKLTGLDSRLRNLTVSADKAINRLVLKAEVKVSGMRTILREVAT